MMVIYNKLVRDKIPQIIENNGQKPITIVLDDNQYKIELDKKLKEEMLEYLEENDIVELADVIEVIYAILNANNIYLSEFEQMLMIANLKRELVMGDNLLESNLTNYFEQEILNYLEIKRFGKLAEVVEIIYSILKVKNISLRDFEQIRKDKIIKNGAFHEKIFLKSVESNNDFYKTFTTLIKEGAYNNTYKMAWAKSLVELASENDPLDGKIFLKDISRKFISYYWDQILNQDFKQGQSTPKMVKVTKKLMKLYASQYELDKFDKIEDNLIHNFNKEYERCLIEGTRILPSHVLWRFTRHNKVKHTELYDYNAKDGCIVFKLQDLKVLKENKDYLIDLIDYRWGLILEKFMGSKKRAKIKNDNLNQELLKKFRTYLY